MPELQPYHQRLRRKNHDDDHPPPQKLLAREIAASPFEIEIVKQDGGHRHVARIFWPFATYPDYSTGNQEREIRSVERGRMCIEWKLDDVGGRPPSWQGPDEYYGIIPDELTGYLRYLEDQKRDHELAATG